MKLKRDIITCKVLMFVSLIIAGIVTFRALSFRNTLSEAEAIIVGLSVLVTVITFRAQDSIRDKHKIT